MNKNFHLLWFVIYCLFIFLTYSSVYDLYRLNTTTGLCLDGSPGAYYASRQGDQNKILLFFQSGGWCMGTNPEQTIQDCYSRSKSGLGSSFYRPDTMQLSDGYSSLNDKNYFKNWKKIQFMYCDGSSHQGTRKQPILYKDTRIYFRGYNITIQILQQLQKTYKLFSQATHVVVGGASAGGLSVFYWLDYIKQKIKKGKVWGLTDSGIFLDMQNIKQNNRFIYKQYLTNLIAYSNQQIDHPVTQCFNQYKQQKVKCFFAERLIKYIKTPIFIIQPLYDSWSIRYILGINCLRDPNDGTYINMNSCNSTQIVIVQNYHLKMKQILQSIDKYNKFNKVYAPACINHVYINNDVYFQDFRVPYNSEITISLAIKDWIQKQTYNSNYRNITNFIDKVKWPQNHSCNGIDNFRFKIQAFLIVFIGILIVFVVIVIFQVIGKIIDKKKLQKKLQKSQFQTN